MADIRKKTTAPTRHQLEKAIKSAFAEQEKFIQQYKREQGYEFRPQISGPYLTRKTEAIVALMPELIKRFADKYPDTNIADTVVTMESNNRDSYDALESHYYVTTAAALWVLDQLRKHNKLADAYKLMTDVVLINDVKMADVYDAIHPQQTISSMVYTIQHRNDSIQGRRFYVIADEGTARKLKVESAFRKILQLIEPYEIETAVQHYEDCVWKWLDLFFDAYNRYCAKLSRLEKRMDEHENKPKQQYNPLLMPNPSQFLQMSSFRNPISAIEKARQELDYTHKEYKRIIYERELYAMSIQMIDGYRSDLSEEQFMSFDNLDVGDPFALCFALIYQLDNGADLPFLYYPGMAVIEKACRKLPWVHDADKTFNGEKRDKYIEVFFKGISDDWYSKAQKIFNATGCLIPRDSGLYEWADKEVGKKLSPAAVVMLDARNLNDFESKFRLAHLDTIEDSNQQEVEATIIPTVQDDTEQEGQLKKYREEIEHLKLQLYEATHSAQTEKHRREAMEAEHALERQELIDLRNYVFSLEQEDDQPIETERIIELPYNVNNRIVVFGGHDSWVKVIRSLLSGVRWIDKDERVKPDIIKNADIVFVQTNAMPHKMFYNVEEYCKKFKVPMRYCCSASAEKCAIQIADADSKLQA